jgi:hypothetical protein
MLKKFYILILSHENVSEIINFSLKNLNRIHMCRVRYFGSGYGPLTADFCDETL